jgi:hypothetical protein
VLHPGKQTLRCHKWSVGPESDIRNRPSAADRDVEVLPCAGPRKDDFAVIWTSDEFGARRVGRIRLVTEYTRELVTLRDAGDYIAKLPKREHDRPEWQIAVTDPPPP